MYVLMFLSLISSATLDVSEASVSNVCVFVIAVFNELRRSGPAALCTAWGLHHNSGHPMAMAG